MKRTIVVDEAGRIVLPKDIREAIGVSGRTALHGEVVNGTLLIRLPEAPDALEQQGNRRMFVGKLSEEWDSGEAVLKLRANRVQR